jgi:iron(III) transport system permease protein
MTALAAPTGPARRSGVRLGATTSDRVAWAALATVALLLVAFLAAPLLAILLQAVQDDKGGMAGLANFAAYVRTPALLQSLWNSVWVSLVVTVVAVPAAFVFAYALTRSCMPAKALFRGITLIPLLAPTLRRLPPCADDPRDGAHGRRLAPVRGR